MSSSKPIGGYFGIEPQGGDGAFPYPDSILLNTGRNCFEYVLRAKLPTKVYMPKYTCDVMLEPLQKLGISYDWYSIDRDLEVAQNINLNEDELLVYTNYFGVKNDYSYELGKRYGHNLVLDCSQAFYFSPLKQGHTFYSPRKFFGLPDGGCLFTDEKLTDNFEIDVSDSRTSHLYKREALGAEAGYEDFKVNDASLIGEPIKQMSQFTKDLIYKIDYEGAKSKRNQNFMYLHENLKDSNQLKIDANIDGPMVYPYISKNDSLRQKLIDEKVFVATYWPNVFEWCQQDEMEYELAHSILPLPIDQRYDIDDMRIIINLIESSL